MTDLYSVDRRSIRRGGSFLNKEYKMIWIIFWILGGLIWTASYRTTIRRLSKHAGLALLINFAIWPICLGVYIYCRCRGTNETLF